VNEVTKPTASFLGAQSSRPARSRIHGLHFVIKQAVRNAFTVVVWSCLSHRWSSPGSAGCASP